MSDASSLIAVVRRRKAPGLTQTLDARPSEGSDAVNVRRSAAVFHRQTPAADQPESSAPAYPPGGGTAAETLGGRSPRRTRRGSVAGGVSRGVPAPIPSLVPGPDRAAPRANAPAAKRGAGDVSSVHRQRPAPTDPRRGEQRGGTDSDLDFAGGRRRRSLPG